MTDPTETKRRQMVGAINSKPHSRQALEQCFGPANVWDTDGLREHFDVLSFAAPFCIVARKSDGKKGTVMFQHEPRLYYDFSEA